MTNTTDLAIKSDNFLKNNPHLYAHKARRKKIALISVKVDAGSHCEEVRIDLRTATLIAGEKRYNVEAPNRLIRKFSEFTWDFLFFAILDFHPVLVAVDVFFLLAGPIYNRRLKKQLRLLSDGEMVLQPGECKKAILGFRRVSKGATQLRLRYRCGGGEQQEITCDIG